MATATLTLPAEEIAEIISGTIDLYVHPNPELLNRTIGVVELAEQMKADGFGAAMLWNQFSATAEMATVVTGLTGFQLYGSAILNGTLGGVNPRVVEHSIRMGAVYVSMPSLSGSGGYQTPAMTSYSNEAKGIAGPVAVTDDSGALLPGVREVIDLLKTYDVALGLGYLNLADTTAVLAAAKDAGVKRIAVLRPFAGFGLTAEELAVVMEVPGTVIQMPASSLRQGKPEGPTRGLGTYEDAVRGTSDIAPDFVAAVKQYGADRCVLTSDTGWNDISAFQWLELAVDGLVELGVTRAEVRTMLHESPARLIGVS